MHQQRAGCQRGAEPAPLGSRAEAASIWEHGGGAALGCRGHGGRGVDAGNLAGMAGEFGGGEKRTPGGGAWLEARQQEGPAVREPDRQGSLVGMVLIELGVGTRSRISREVVSGGGEGGAAREPAGVGEGWAAREPTGLGEGEAARGPAGGGGEGRREGPTGSRIGGAARGA